MSVPYRIVPKSNPNNPSGPKKYYPVLRSRGRTTTRELARGIADESTISPADTMAVLEAFFGLVSKELARGNIVDLGPLGSFYLRIRTKGAERADEVTEHHIAGVLPAFRPSKSFKEQFQALDFEKVSD